MLIQNIGGSVRTLLFRRAFQFGASKLRTVHLSLPGSVLTRAALLQSVEINDVAHCIPAISGQPGLVIFFGCTSRSNSAPDTIRMRTASSLSVVPFACAAFATFAALS